MKIAIMSDSHENWANLKKAIEISNTEGCTELLFAGDLIAPPGIAILEEFNGNVHFIWGNNEAERAQMTRYFDASAKITLEYTAKNGNYYEGELDGIKIFMTHEPRFAELAAKSGEFNLCIHGHTHEYRNEQVGNTLLVNPGEIQGYKTGQITFIIFDTKTREVKKVNL